MKKLIIVLVAGAFGLTSCNKEVKLENRLDGKWTIDSYSREENSVVTFVAGSESIMPDTTYSTAEFDPAITVVTTGDIDFVSDYKFVKYTNEETTEILSDGSSDIENNENRSTSEYYVSGVDEVTLLEDGSYRVYTVTSNEKDSQTWEHESTETLKDGHDGGLRTTVTTLKIKYTLSVVK